MASANPQALEDQISCSICFEIYRDPQILRECFHTFCLQCIDKLVKGGRIQCPKCRVYTNRENVKKDFSMQGFIDLHQKQTLESKEKPPTTGTCGLCFVSERPIKSFCEHCENYMCSGCEIIHSRMKFEKKHVVKSIKQVIQECNAQFTDTLDELSKQSNVLDENICDIDQSMVNVETAWQTQLEDVKKFTEDHIKELIENQKSMEEMINESNGKLLAQLSELKKVFTKSQEEIQQHMEGIADFISSGDVKVLKEKVHKVNQSTQDDLQEIKANLPQFQKEIKSPVNVSKGRLWDAKSSIDISIECYELTVHTTDYNYLEILKHRYTVQCTESLDLKYSPTKLCLINDQIWCGSSNGEIYIYDKDCTFIRALNEKRYPGNITLCQANNKDVIVACSNGLLQLNSAGNYQMKITDGTFSDVCCFGNAVYALDTNLECILIYNAHGNNWRNNKQIKLQNQNVHSWDRLAVGLNGIYVSSFNEKSLYKYNLNGSLMNHFKPESLRGPFISGTDSSANALISDYRSGHLVVCDGTGKCQRVNLSVEIRNIPHALVDVQKNQIWAVSHGGQKIYKFVKHF